MPIVGYAGSETLNLVLWRRTIGSQHVGVQIQNGGELMITERSLEVLRAIVGDYVATSEPVGSQRIVDRHGFNVSAATIRNDMSALEEAELITAPHTSSGRIPTDKGYRVFVDRLAEVRPLSPAQRRAISQFMAGTLDPEQLLDRSVRMLAQLTGSVAIGHLPSLLNTDVHRIELVPLHERRVLTVLITDSGRVEQRITELPDPATAELLERLRDRFNEQLVGKRLRDAAALLRNPQDFLAPEDVVAARPLAAALVDQVLANQHHRLVIAGAANLARSERDFSTILPLLEAIEEQVVLLRLFTELDINDREVAVSIGQEHEDATLEETSVVATQYRAEGGAARVGLLGPTRMDYSNNIAAVRAVARYLSRLADDLHD